TFRIGTMRGAVAVAARFDARPNESALHATLEKLVQDKAVACGEIWLAAHPGGVARSEEERLRGGDPRIEACLLVETLRIQDGEIIAEALSKQFATAAIGLYRLLCEVRAAAS